MSTKKTKVQTKKTKVQTKKTPNMKKIVIKKSVKKAPIKKKITKKKSVKKTAPKKTAPKQRVSALVCAPGKQCFWTTDGKVLQDLNQLQMAFGSMGDEVFLHHVTKEKNDFADWVEYVLEDSKCAEDLRRSKKPTSARTVVVRHLRLYNI